MLVCNTPDCNWEMNEVNLHAIRVIVEYPLQILYPCTGGDVGDDDAIEEKMSLVCSCVTFCLFG